MQVLVLKKIFYILFFFFLLLWIFSNLNFEEYTVPFTSDQGMQVITENIQ